MKLSLFSREGERFFQPQKMTKLESIGIECELEIIESIVELNM